MIKSELQNTIKDFRFKKGLSQEALADLSGLSLRTIQRLENGDSYPRGDTLIKLSNALQVSQDEIIEWEPTLDKNVLKMLHLSQLSFILFPILGLLLPLVIWIVHKDKTIFADRVGKAIINFQFTWFIIFGLYFFIFVFINKLYLDNWLPAVEIKDLKWGIIGCTIYYVLLIIYNTIWFTSNGKSWYKPAISIFG